MEADIVDDVFQYPFVGQEIYKNDSIQFGMITNNEGLDSFAFLANGSFTFDFVELQVKH
ncbi:MAG: hypothetical protein K0Q90_1572 [Paenibacillaceae bacterium]|nr:hypothetical protein [Paenibacillaceae bacterium]